MTKARQTDRLLGSQTDRLMGRQTDRLMGRQTDRLMGRHRSASSLLSALSAYNVCEITKWI